MKAPNVEEMHLLLRQKENRVMRDEFAKACLPSMIEHYLKHQGHHAFNAEDVAASCYMVANHMMIEREKMNA